jgi:integrase
MPLPSDQLKVERYLQEWLQSTQPSIRPSIWRRYEQLLRLHAIPILGTLPLTRLEPRHVQRLYTDCLAQGLAPATVRQLHAMLRRALGQATKWGTVARNVAALASPPRVKRHEIQPLSATQARTFLDAAQGDRFEALYVLALTTGMGLGELLGLRWRDVDLAAGMLQVHHTLLRLRDGLQLREPKTARSRRRIALAPSAVDALHHHRSRQAAIRLQLGPAWEDHDLVFANEIGKPVEAGNLLRGSFWPLLDKAEIPPHPFSRSTPYGRDTALATGGSAQSGQ